MSNFGKYLIAFGVGYAFGKAITEDNYNCKYINEKYSNFDKGKPYQNDFKAYDYKSPEKQMGALEYLVTDAAMKYIDPNKYKFPGSELNSKKDKENKESCKCKNHEYDDNYNKHKDANNINSKKSDQMCNKTIPNNGEKKMPEELETYFNQIHDLEYKIRNFYK